MGLLFFGIFARPTPLLAPVETFQFDKLNDILPRGAGMIKGKVLLDGEPYGGREISLSLDSKETESVRSNREGIYVIRVPTGTYSRIHASSFDILKKSEPLVWLENYQRIGFRMREIQISANQWVVGPTIRLGRTIKLLRPSESISASGKDVLFQWKPNPRVSTYKIKVFPYTASQPGSRGKAFSNRRISTRTGDLHGVKIYESPPVKGSEFLWKDFGVQIGPNKIYCWGIEGYRWDGELITASDVSDLKSCLFYYLSP